MQVDSAHDRVERITHWVHAANATLLLLSGFQIHAPSFNLFLSMHNARVVHFATMYLFLAIGVIHVYQFFALGKHKVAMFRRTDLKDLGPLVKYYLFLSKEEPPYAKYNVLQKLSYAAVFGLAGLQAALGFILYWPERLAVLATMLGGLAAVREYHYLIAWGYLAFTAVHLYLVLSTDIRLVVTMVNGRKPRELARPVLRPVEVEAEG